MLTTDLYHHVLCHWQ